MSPAGVAQRPRPRGQTTRRGPRRRAAIRRRRRLVLAAVGTAIVTFAVILTLPLLRKAVNDLTLPLRYTDVIRQQAGQKHLDPALIAAVIYAETKFEPRDSAVGAMGPMQIMPQTASFLARRSGATTFTVADLDTPRVNIAYGSYYLRYLLDEYGGSVTLALAAYNGGESNVNRWVAVARAHRHAFRVRDIQFPETRAYVERVLNAERQYRRKYADQLYG